MLLWIVHPICMGIIIPIGKHEWCFSFECKAKGYGIQLNMVGDNHWSLIRLTGELKPKHEWTKPIMKVVKPMLVRTLFNIFNGVCPDEFHKIENWKCAKEAWDILQVTHEGTSFVKISKLQMLTSK